MDLKEIIYEVRGATGWIYLNRPEDMNSLSPSLLSELDQVLGQIEADDSIRIVAVSGKGKAFCAGADLKSVLASLNEGQLTGPDFLDYFTMALNRLRNHPRPVIAAVNGLALAGGLELIMCCDLVVAAENAVMGDAHSNFGVFPAGGGAAILPRRIGLQRAKFLLFTGGFISAKEMMEYGLVNQVVADDKLEETVQALADRLAEKSPLVLKRMKEVANQSLHQAEDAALRHELLNLKDHMKSFDAREGLNAFSEKRKPEFKGY